MQIQILALDDESVILEYLERIFTDEIFNLKVFDNADEFIKAFNKDVDLIITDLRVPGYDAYKTLAQFKSINRGVYIIVISAFFDENVYERLFELDVDRVIRKGDTMNWIKKIGQYVNELFPRIFERAKILA